MNRAKVWALSWEEETLVCAPIPRLSDLDAELRFDLRKDSAALDQWWRDVAGEVRFVLIDSRTSYPPLLRRGLRIGRSWDLRLVEELLVRAEATTGTTPRGSDMPTATVPGTPVSETTSFAEPSDLESDPSLFAVWEPVIGSSQICERYLAQMERLDHLTHTARLRYLAAIESAGGLIAAELRHDGLPIDVDEHHRLITDIVGELSPGQRPPILADLERQVTDHLQVGEFNIDSPQSLLAALRRAGLDVKSTSKWELREMNHPAIEPLLDYKKRSRLLAAHGPEWIRAWVHPAAPEAAATSRPRFRPEYVVAGVVTGRWATRGSGAMQIPAALRSAIRPDPGWKLVVADAAQIEPRCLAAMARDDALAQAGQHADLYAGLVQAGVAADRGEAKLALLGALYGATTGASGRLLPRLEASFPRATALVAHAAQTGEQGGQVHTWLGRRSPVPPNRWWALISAAPDSAGSSARAQQARRDWGRFTRNYVVQGTAAEWAMAWMVLIRQYLTGTPAHLCYFLHDEVVIHAPEDQADYIATKLPELATAAGRHLFGDQAVSFPLHVSVVDDYSQDTKSSMPAVPESDM